MSKTQSTKRRLAQWVAITASIALATTFTLPSTVAHATTPDPNPNALEIANSMLSQQAATEGIVLLENNNNALPIAKDGNIAIFGVGAQNTVKGGGGSGAVNQRATRADWNVWQALLNAGYNVTTNPAYFAAVGTSIAANNAGYFNADKPLDATTVQPLEPTSTALYVITRYTAEGSDMTPAQFGLTATELANIDLVAQTYDNVIVLLNGGGVIDTSFFKTVNAAFKDPKGGDGIDALVQMGQGGQNVGAATIQVLRGDVNPSGKTVDTWASQYSYYPASATFASNDGNTTTEQYSEGIYVGYRYFDSFYKTINPAAPDSVVDYPFGYGLSYTTFKIESGGVVSNGTTVTVYAKVTNTGSVAGKEVVQVYFSAPAGGVDKPYQELAGYAKTDTLAPGASQTVAITYNVVDMASYHESTSNYQLDPGNYLIRLGDSSRSTKVVAKLSLAKSVVTEQDQTENPGSPVNPLSSDPANFYTYATEAAEIAAAPSIAIDPASVPFLDARSPYYQDKSVATPAAPYNTLGLSGYTNTEGLGPITTYLPSSLQAGGNWDTSGAPYVQKPNETIQYVDTLPGATIYDVYDGKISMQQFVAGLTVAQVIAFENGAGRVNIAGVTAAVGAAGYTTAAYTSLGISQMVLSDGPAGIRITQQPSTGNYQWCTAWPIGTNLAQMWNRDLVQQVGNGIGAEMAEWGVDLWLAPGMNIHRDPLNGRNFEYYSEDPLVSGLSAAAVTKGVQANAGVGVTLKHYYGNNQESSRSSVNNIVTERAQREIYWKGFEIAVKTAQPKALMTSYNKNNGTWSSMNYDAITNVLRGEWGFKGLVMTDWGGNHTGGGSMYAGNDLLESSGNVTAAMYLTGGWRLGEVQRSAINILTNLINSQSFGQLAATQGRGDVTITPWAPTKTAKDIMTTATVTSAVPSAMVTKDNGNTNTLKITVVEYLSDGTSHTVTATFTIANNAADTYQVGTYRVYVDTKGNTQVRSIYFV